MKQAVHTNSEDVALFRTRQMAMYVQYHDSTARIVRFVPAGKYVIGAVDARGALVVALPTDYVAWTPNVAGIALGARDTLAGVEGVNFHTIRTTGPVSQLGRSSLKSLGWSVQTEVALELK